MRTKSRDASGRSTEQDVFDVDLDRLVGVVPLGHPERVVDRTTGEAIREDGVDLWQVNAGVPGSKLSGGSIGLCEVRLRIVTPTQPTFGPYEALRLHGPVRVTGRTVGERQDRQGFLSLKCRGVSSHQDLNMTAEFAPTVPGIPILLGDGGGLPVLAASEPRSVYDGRPVEVFGQRQMRLQVSTLRTFTRTDGSGDFTRHEAVTVDLPKSTWEANPIPFLARVELIDLRCDAQVTNQGRVLMALAAAGYRIVPGTAATPVPSGRRGRPEVDTGASAEPAEVS